MNAEMIQPILLIFVRYSISSVGTLMAAYGFAEADSMTVMDQLAIIITGGMIAAAPAVYASIKRWFQPSPKAMEAAKAIDAYVPKEDAVIIKTPPDQPDIIVGPKP